MRTYIKNVPVLSLAAVTNKNGNPTVIVDTEVGTIYLSLNGDAVRVTQDKLKQNGITEAMFAADADLSDLRVTIRRTEETDEDGDTTIDLDLASHARSEPEVLAMLFA